MAFTDLAPEEVRILGCLVEKQLTTPLQYPLTLNGLVAGCNQSSNRNPVVNYDEGTVEAALARLKERRLVRFVHPSHGRSVIRYRQVLHEELALETPELAVLGVLMLRGPQTPGEVRARAERMATFDSIGEVEALLDALAGRGEALIMRLARVPGQKEERYAHLLSGEPDPQAYEAAAPSPAPNSSVVAEVAELRLQVEELRRDLQELRSLLGG